MVWITAGSARILGKNVGDEFAVKVGHIALIKKLCQLVHS